MRNYGDNMKPKIVLSVARGHPDYAKASALAAQVGKVIDQLHGVGMFEAASPKQVVIAHGSDAITRADRRPSSKGFDYPFEFSAVWIELGHGLLVDGEGSRLVALGASEQEALAFILAHEMRHVTDPARASGCRATLSQAKSFFCNAMDPRLPAEVNELLRLAATEFGSHERAPFPGHILLPLDVARAHDVAVEFRADLGAMLWLQRAGLWTPALQAMLIFQRATDEADEPPSKYQIGTEWPNFVNVANFDEASLRTVTRCIDLLANSPNVSTALGNAARAISLPIDMAPDAPPALGLLGKIKRGLGL